MRAHPWLLIGLVACKGGEPSTEAEVARHRLTVEVVGPGRVVSAPAGIDCPGACELTLREGASVTLSAIAEPGFELEALAGDCQGAGPCALTMSRDRRVDASFARPPVPRALFGVNVHWEELGDGIMQGGELVRDRSFRMPSGDGSRPKQYWLDFTAASGVVTFPASGGAPAPAGGQAYPGHATLSATADPGSIACLWQVLLDGVDSGTTYEATLAVRGVGAAHTPAVYLVDSTYASLMAQGSAGVSAPSGTWAHVGATLVANRSAGTAMLGVCTSGEGSVEVDEVRLRQQGAEPSVTALTKARLAELGVTGLRWPGGTGADAFVWGDSVGPLASRGEVPEFGTGVVSGYQTPALGLHELLDLCEELGLEPLIQVNVEEPAARAAELVEYILGPTTLAQGLRRSANGRAAPWSFVRYFELGNEPSANYASGAIPDAGTDYAALSAAVAEAMHAAAQPLGVELHVSAALEATFQLADWLPGNTDPAAQLVANWNGQVMAPGGPLRAQVDMAHGHFYPFFAYDGGDLEVGFTHLMAGGALLSRTMSEALAPHLSGAPLWITEYQVIVHDAAGAIDPARTYDFQSGLAVADMLLAMLEAGIPGAHLFALSQAGPFGALRDPSAWHRRPAALAFELLAVVAGERPLDVQATVTGLTTPSFVVSPGLGSIPDGLTYDKVTVFATRNAATGRPRIFVLNRDFSETATVALSLAGSALGGATRHLLHHADVRADNELDPANVAVAVSTLASAATLTVPPHALVRLDY